MEDGEVRRMALPVDETSMEAADFGRCKRKQVYEYGLTRCLPLSGISRDTIDSQRSAAWMTREISTILPESSATTIEFIVNYIIGLARTQGLDAIRDDEVSQDLLYGYAPQFAGELQAFLESSLSMEDYDKYVAYKTSLKEETAQQECH